LAESAFARLGPEGQVGQLLMLALTDQPGLADAAVQAGHVGNVIFLGKNWSMQAARQESARVQALVPDPGVRLFVAADQEGGRVQHLSAGFTPIPSAAEQGTWPVDQLAGQAAAWGAELAQAGVNVNLAPVADTVAPGFGPLNAPIGAIDRAFGTDPETVGGHAAAFVQGMRQAGVATAVKHFPGLGRVTGNTDFTTEGIVDTETTADDPWLGAFQTAVDAGASMVMVSLAVYDLIDPGAPAAFSPLVVTDLLRARLGWDGVVISDSLSAQAVRAVAPADRAVAFVRAGGDIAIFESAEEIDAARQGLTAAMAADPAFAALVGAAALRVLQAKEAAGLLG
jgi:beta-N-acetylhexosaminidase